MVLWVIRLILYGGAIDLLSFQPMLHDWCNKGCGMCYPLCGMMHIKEPLLPMGWQQVSSLAIWVVLYHIFDAIQP